MKRGDIAPVALSGDYGKPRPALIIQSNLFDDHPSITILPITSDLCYGSPLLRIPVQPNDENGLLVPSQIMIDKVHTLRREKVGTPFGLLNDEVMVAVNRSLALFLGFA
jgi:mRNA interferase MazF